MAAEPGPCPRATDANHAGTETISCVPFFGHPPHIDEAKKGAEPKPRPPFSSFPRIPNLTPFGVVVRNVLHAGKLEVVFHGLNLLLNVRELVM